MKIIVTTGYPDSGFQTAHQQLLTAGLKEAGVSQREGLTVHQIQKKIFKAYQKESRALGSSVQLAPGRIWHELAVHFLISNSDHSEWGWADAGTVRLLDFWKEIEPEICFVLIYSSPEFAVAKALRNQPSTQETIQNIIAGWEACNNELLRFYHRHTDQCMLVNISSITHVPELFIGQVADLFDLDLKFLNVENQGETHELTAMPALLASTLIEDYQDARALYCELESSANISENASGIKSAEKQLAWQEYTSLLSDLDQTLAERDEQASLAEDRQSTLVQFTAQLEDVRCSLNSKQSETNARQTQANELQQVNELLLLQWYQVQEELEHYILKYNELNDSVKLELDEAGLQIKGLNVQLETSDVEKVTLLESMDQLAKLAEDRQLTLEQLTAKFEVLRGALISKQSEIDALQAQATELQQENELLLFQLHQVQEELEQYFLQYQKLKGNVQRESGNIAFFTQFWHEQQPSEIHIDMKRQITGENWYDAEHDGRWAGPANISTLKVPALRDGRYRIILDIADAIDPEIINGLELSVNGMQTPLKIKEYYGGPEYFEAEFSTSEIQKANIWDIQFKFSKLMSPTQQDPDDHRLIAIRLKSLSLNLL